MRKIVLFSLLFPLCLAAEFAGVRLQFLPHVPVIQTSIVTVEIEQFLPGMTLRTVAKQTLSAELRVLSDDSSEAKSSPPMELQYTLQQFHVDLEANGEKASYSSQDTAPAALGAQMQELIGRPLLLKFGQDFALEGPIEELQILEKILPMFKQLFPASVFHELFQHLFALAGKQLATGDETLRKVTLGDKTKLSLPVKYEVTSVNFKEVEARLSGDVEGQTVTFGRPLQVDDSDRPLQPAVEIQLRGKLTGKGTWSRRHALLYEMDVEHDYKADLSVGNLNWPATLRILQHTDTKRQY